MRKLTRADIKTLLFNEKVALSGDNIFYEVKCLIKTFLWITKVNRLAKRFNIELYAVQGLDTSIAFTKEDGNKYNYLFRCSIINDFWFNPEKYFKEQLKRLEGFCTANRRLALGILIPLVTNTRGQPVGTYCDMAILRR